MRCTDLVLAAALVCTPALADELHVPDPYLTIQSAIDAAFDGDVVLVGPGTYYENIDFLGKAITVASSDGPHATTIRGVMEFQSVIVFRSGEGLDSVLEGFTIRNGQGTCITVEGDGNYSFGGGIFCDTGASPSILHNIVTENTTTSVCASARRLGGGIALRENSEAFLFENTIENNSLDGTGVRRGAGVYCGPGSNPVIRGNVIRANPVPESEAENWGGGICCEDCTPTIESNRIEDHVGDVHFGGGIYLTGVTEGLVRWNEISGNAANRGGGIFVRGGEPVFTQNRIIGNLARGFVGQGGGGLYLADSRARVLNNHIAENQSPRPGGGLFVKNLNSSSTPRIEKNRFFRNGSNSTGGGIMWKATHFVVTPSLVNNVVAYNFSSSNGGGISFFGADDAFIDARLINNTIVGNHVQRGAVFVDGVFCGQNSAATLVNSIVWDNDLGGALDVTYCDVEGGWTGEGNIDLDPRLVGPDHDDFRLRMDSPCVDTGTDVVDDAPTRDYEGDVRPADGDMDSIAVIDMGADECRPDHAVLFGTVNLGAGPLAKVLFLNGGTGGEKRTVTVDSDGPIRLEISLPPHPLPGICRYVVHADVGMPTPETMTLLPAEIGWTAFPFLLGDGSAAAAVFNCLGKESMVGPSTYFDGTPIPDPPPAPAIVLDLPAGDPVNLPPGTVITLQGILIDWGTAATKKASVTNGIVMQVE